MSSKEKVRMLLVIARWRKFTLSHGSEVNQERTT